jgi:hypothetical protein
MLQATLSESVEGLHTASYRRRSYKWSLSLKTQGNFMNEYFPPIILNLVFTIAEEFPNRKGKILLL